MAFIENNIGRIDHLIPKIIKNVLVYLDKNEDKSKFFQINIFGVISLCFYYNPLLAFQCLEELKVTSEVFKKWLFTSDNFNKDYDLQRLILGFSSIFKLSES